MNIRKKIIFISSASLVIILILSGIIFIFSNQFNNDLNNIEYSEDISRNVFNLNILLNQYSNNEEERIVVQLQFVINNIRVNLDKIIPQNEYQFRLIEEMDIDRIAIDESLYSLLNEEHSLAISERLISQLLIKSYGLFELTERFGDENRERVIESKLISDMTQSSVIGVLLISLTIQFIIIWQAISKPITELFHLIQKYSAGEHNLIFNPKILSRKDEIGELSRNFFQMIKERQKIEEKLVRSEKLAILGELGGSIAHELRNPLGVISNSTFYLNLVIKDKNEKMKRHFKIIADEIEKSNNIINDLLNFSKLDKINLSLENIHIVIEKSLIKIHFPDNISVKNKFDKSLPEINIDCLKIEQVIINIVTNAVQALPKGGNIIISSTIQDDFIIISIKDNGVGISKEHLETIYEPLFSTKTVGTGLGLAISNNIILAHNGRIECVSKLGEGTSFMIYLPLHNLDSEIKK